MKVTNLSLGAVALLASSVIAFPAGMQDALAKRGINEHDCPHLAARQAGKNDNKKRALGFDAKAQLIDVTGKHAFVAPGPNDKRGPCPALNALANHNYLPHNGVASLAQYTAATNQGLYFFFFLLDYRSSCTCVNSIKCMGWESTLLQSSRRMALSWMAILSV